MHACNGQCHAYQDIEMISGIQSVKTLIFLSAVLFYFRTPSVSFSLSFIFSPAGFYRAPSLVNHCTFLVLNCKKYSSAGRQVDVLVNKSLHVFVGKERKGA